MIYIYVNKLELHNDIEIGKKLILYSICDWWQDKNEPFPTQDVIHFWETFDETDESLFSRFLRHFRKSFRLPDLFT